MGLFDIFRRNGHSVNTASDQSFDIPKDVFVEEKEPGEVEASFNSGNTEKGIDAIYSFLQDDYETKGYNDALINPDDSYRTDNIELFKQDLHILIQRVSSYYGDIIRELDFHISTRSRAGLVDLVEELKSRREMVLEHLSKVEEIQKETEEKKGVSMRIILSYQRGFMRGLSALTQSIVMNKKL